MKKLFVILFAIAASFQIKAQEKPRWIGIVMIGNSDKPIIPLFIVDSTREKKFVDSLGYYLIYADSKTLEKIHFLFKGAKEYDPKKKYDYSFGTFNFIFAFDDLEKRIITTKTPSAVYLQEIICKLSSDDKIEAEIVEKINNILDRINF